jgi:hypothetical protein
MKGIAIIHDETNNKKYAQIDLDIHGELWEDFYDGLMAELAKDEESLSLDELGSQLKKEGLIDEV